MENPERPVGASQRPIRHPWQLKEGLVLFLGAHWSNAIGVLGFLKSIIRLQLFRLLPIVQSTDSARYPYWKKPWA